MNTSIEQSFKSRIRTLAREKRIDTAQLWQNLVLERFLVRLSQSKYASHFILKGGVLLAHYVQLNRYTQDLDFLIRRLSNEISDLEKILDDVIQTPIDDGFTFSNLKVNTLAHPHMEYAGVRATMWSSFGRTKFQVKVDLGFGDLIVPTTVFFPLIKGKKEALFENEIEVFCYPKEFIFAEKLETIVYRNTDNSRMKDFHDLYILIETDKLEPEETAKVVKSVFEHRKTKMNFPIIFSADDLGNFQQFWNAHLRALPPMHAMPKDFSQVVFRINHWLMTHVNVQ